MFVRGAGLIECRRLFPHQPLCILWLGSSVGNLAPEEAVHFLRSMLEVLGPESRLFLCADLWKDAATLRAAYCDSKGVTEAFIKNGMANALRQLGHPAAGDPENWEYEVRTPFAAKWPLAGVRRVHCAAAELCMSKCRGGEEVRKLRPKEKAKPLWVLATL
jgi:Histidine-specific methyltransferase, SAM-dependent